MWPSTTSGSPASRRHRPGLNGIAGPRRGARIVRIWTTRGRSYAGVDRADRCGDRRECGHRSRDRPAGGAEGAGVIIAGRDPGRLERAAREVGAQPPRPSTPPIRAVGRVLPRPAGADRPRAGHRRRPPLRADAGDGPRRGRAALSDHVLLALAVARNAVARMRPGGTLLFMGGTGARRISRGSASRRPPRRRCRRSSPPSRWRSRRSGPTSSRPGSSTPRCRRRCSATRSTSAAQSCGRPCRSAAWSARPTSPRSRCTS